MNHMKKLFALLTLAAFTLTAGAQQLLSYPNAALTADSADSAAYTLPGRTEVLSVLRHVNNTWQQRNTRHGNHFWNRAVYHIGNMEAYGVTEEQQYLDYSTAWAEKNAWSGAQSNDTAQWAYTYGEGGRYVLFGDNQACFQVYADLFNLDANHDTAKIARAMGVMDYQMQTANNDYLWWVDGMFMVMPTMAKLYGITHDSRYLEKMHDYWTYAHQLMFDADCNLYYRDAKYIYPAHTTLNGGKDFWARGDGWAFATFARLLDLLPADAVGRADYEATFLKMAEALKQCQQTEGYWTRSLLDPAHAPGRETSGTALNAYAYATGLRLGLLGWDDYGPTLAAATDYLLHTAYQADGTVGYIQPIGERADPNQTLSATSYYDFGVGAYLMAAAALSRIAPDTPYLEPLRLQKAEVTGSHTVTLTFNTQPEATVAADASHYTWDGTTPDLQDVSLDGCTLCLTLADSIDYAVHTLAVSGLRSAEGGAQVGETSMRMVRTVPLDAPQNNIVFSAIGSQEGNPYSHVADGSLDTRWSQQGRGQWLVADLGQVASVWAVDVAFYNGNQRTFYFDIETSDDSITWQTAVDGASSSGLTNQMERYAFAPVSARYVRMVCNGNSQNDWNSPTEMRIRFTTTPTAIDAPRNADDTARNADRLPAYDLLGRPVAPGSTRRQIVIRGGRKMF
jgi:rhamnogalacturonyl hydrolase YesR